jgi:hypothetical protein
VLPKSSSSRGLATFRGDFGPLAEMMQRSWADNREDALLYTEEFLRSAFDYPGSSFDLAPAVYGDAGLLGFVAGFPRSILWDNRSTRLTLTSLLTASADIKGAGLGLKLWGDLIARSRRAGHGGAISYCVEGDGMNRMITGLSQLLRLNTQRIFSASYFVRFLQPIPPAASPEVSEQDIDLFLDLTGALAEHLPLVRAWTRPEAEWQCRRRAGAITVTLRVSGRRGLLTGYIIQVASTPPTPVVLLDDLLWGDLEPAERAALLDEFLRAAAARGALTASCPVLGYSSTDPLTAARFRRSRRVVHIYLTFWNGFEPHPVQALYIDVV